MISRFEEPVAEQHESPAASNGELLRAFVHGRDEEAFAALVKRHGPMVFGVCRRLLGNEHDAADAFQAAFLVLARKAASIRAPEVLGTWLYNVAYRTSLKARNVRLKRAVRERQVSVMPEPAVEDAAPIDDLPEVLDEELRALPAKHQAAIVLCDLQGCSRKEAAAALKIAEGTLSSRLSQGRQRLAARLRRRGVAVSATALAVTLAESSAGASVPAPLIAATVKAAIPTLAGQAAAGVASAKSLAIANGVMNAMLLAKLKVVLLALAALCALTGAWQVNVMVREPEPDQEAQALATLKKLGARLRWEAVLKGKQLVAVDLNRSKVRDEHLKVLRVLPGLRELSLNDTPVTDAGCPDLAELKKLRRLEIKGTAITDAGMRSLASLMDMEMMSLGGSKISDVALQELASLVELRQLGLWNTAIGDAGLPHLKAFKKLQSLHLGKTHITDAGLRHLAGFAELRVLNLEDTGVTDKGLPDLAAGGQIASLSLEGNAGVTDAGVRALMPLRDLNDLNLAGTGVTDAGLPPLAAFPRLRVLNLDRTAVTGVGLLPAARSRMLGPRAAAPYQLQTLRLSQSKVSDESLKAIAALTTLQELQLAGTAITDAGVKQLVALKHLESLSINDTALTDAAAPVLAGFQRLWLLNLSHTKITDAGLKELAKLPRLRWLALHNTAITNAGLKNLSPLRGMDTLWLSWSKVTEPGLKDLAPFRNLQSLRLGGLPITDAGLKDLAPLTNLRALWLDWTKITDAGLKQLPVFRHLEELRLDGTPINGSGLAELAVLPKLQRLELQKSQANPVAVDAARTALPQVTINAQAKSPTEPAAVDDPPSSFGWLIILLGCVVGLILLAWLISRYRSMSWGGVITATGICAGFAILTFLGSHLVQGRAQTAPAAPAVVPVERILRGHKGPIHALSFTPDARRLVSASGWPGKDASIRIWDLTTDQEIHCIKAPGQVGSMVLSADGRFALAGTFGALLYIDVESGQVVKRLRNGYTGSPGVAFSAGGRHVYSASQDGYARRWDLETGNVVGRFRVAGKWARFVGELPSGRLLTADSGGVLQIWDIQSQQEIKRIEAGPLWLTSAMIAPGARQVFVGGWQVSAWDLETGSKVQAFQGHKNHVSSITLSPDGKTLLTASEDGTARLWDFETAAPVQMLLKQEEWLFAAACSRDGRWIAIGGGGNKEGKNYVGGTQHDIHIFEMPPPPAEPVQAAESSDPPWMWIGGVVLAALILGSTALLVVRRRSGLKPTGSEMAGGSETSRAPLTFSCTQCGTRLRARPQLAGKTIKCPKCAASTPVG